MTPSRLTLAIDFLRLKRSNPALPAAAAGL
jgi:hypothetical protein